MLRRINYNIIRIYTLSKPPIWIFGFFDTIECIYIGGEWIEVYIHGDDDVPIFSFSFKYAVVST